MDDIKILEEIGLKEVSKKTHIEGKFLNFMINKEFDKLNKINALGYVKILKREYNLDLDSWVEEFEAYLQEHEEKTEIDAKALFTEEFEEPKTLNKTWIFALVGLLLFAFLFWKFDGIGLLNNLKYNTNSQEQIKIEEVNKTINKPEQKISIQTQEIQAEDNKEELNVSAEQNQNSEARDSEIKENEAQDIDQKIEQQIAQIVEENSTQETEADQEQIDNINDIKTEEDNNTAQENETLQKSQMAFLKPKRRIWVGILDLTTGKKTQKLTTRVIDINLSSPKLIVAGHGDFILTNENGENQEFNSELKQYYMVEDGKIMQINRKKFVEENGGKKW